MGLLWDIQGIKIRAYKPASFNNSSFGKTGNLRSVGCARRGSIQINVFDEDVGRNNKGIGKNAFRYMLGV